MAHGERHYPSLVAAECCQIGMWSQRRGKSLPKLRASTAPISTWQFRSTPCPTPCRARMQGNIAPTAAFVHVASADPTHDEAASARLFLCAGCRAQVLICSCCDRGQIYCAGDCAPHARRQCASAPPAARYQTSVAGGARMPSAARRYRARRQKRDASGFTSTAAGDLLAPGSLTIASDAATPDDRPRRPISHCHWCGRRCPRSSARGFCAAAGVVAAASRHDRTGARPW